MKRDDILEGLFADPTLKAEKGFFLTSDNQAFSEGHKLDGANHAKTLEDGSLEWFSRSAKQGGTEEAGTEEGETEVAKVVAPAKPKGAKGKTKKVATEEVKEVGTKEGVTEEVSAGDVPALAEASDILQ